MDEAAARARLERMVAASSDPVLTTEEIDDLVADAKRPDPVGNLPTNVATAAVWQASTVYAHGTVVTASPAAGRWWRVVVPGTSGTTQPSWPDLSGQVAWGTTVYDGTVRWEDAGSAWAPTWDLHAAAVNGWELKAAKAAEDFDFTTDGQVFPRSQVIDHCERMAATHRRRVVCSAPVT